jgi:3-methylfumaryl-CoA hydratase
MSGKWEAWIGREQSASDHLSHEHAQRWLATFDLAEPTSGAMPQGVHFALCTPNTLTAELGQDGHPLRDESEDSFLPPVPMPRRMWASSDIEFHGPISVSAKIARASRIADISEKTGGSGTLVFVKVMHETHADTVLAVRETQTLVYRAAAAPDTPLSPPALSGEAFGPSGWDAYRTLIPDPRLLFRYSALTFNTHRIHYDAPYAENEERYRGLVVHGPLTASLLLQLAASQLGDNALKSFAFRGVSPAIAGEPLHLVMRQADGSVELAAFADDGRQITKASAAI